MTLNGKVLTAFVISLVGAASVHQLILTLLGPSSLAWVLGSFAGVLIGLPAVRWILKPVHRGLETMNHGVDRLRDGDLAARLVVPKAQDEFSKLIDGTNKALELLHHERQRVFQRELLLDTIIQQSQTGVILIDLADRIVLANRFTRKLLGQDQKLEGRSFAPFRLQLPAVLRANHSDVDDLIAIETEEGPQSLHLSQKTITLHSEPHLLILIKPMTHEISRKEAQVWKKVIRLISHELNNSLAPISSMIHSAKTIRENEALWHLGDRIFDTISDRLNHLNHFIGGYARFARLPEPNVRPVKWCTLMDEVNDMYRFRLTAELPPEPGTFDLEQVQQVMINLLKNAHEASQNPEVQVGVVQSEQLGSVITVIDNGPGMDPKTLKRAHLPFYSTGQSERGLGLPLCHEIIAAHGGRMTLENRNVGGLLVRCVIPWNRPQN